MDHAEDKLLVEGRLAHALLDRRLRLLPPPRAWHTVAQQAITLQVRRRVAPWAGAARLRPSPPAEAAACERAHASSAPPIAQQKRA
eukprot:373949-Rhodomonas_salina.2